MGNPQIIRTETGEDLVVLSRRDYDALPEAVWQAIEEGQSPVKVRRQLKGLSQTQLAEMAGFSQAYIAEIETGRKHGTAESLKAIAQVLGVPLDVLVA